jgi:hypothetical protein
MSNEHETSQLIESGQNRKNLTISILIKQAKSLTKVELQEWSTLLREVFGNGEDEMEWADIDWNVLVKLGNKLVSQVDIIDRIAQVGYHKVRLGGIGGVGTLPEFRGRGLCWDGTRQCSYFHGKGNGCRFWFSLLFS